MAPAKKGSASLASPTGYTGLRKIGGYVAADFLPQLQGLQGVRAYTEMSLNDPVVSALLFAVSMMIRNIEWQIEAAGDDATSQKAREEWETALFTDLDPSFSEMISEVCTMFPYGFAPLEIVWGKKDNNWMPKKLSLRSQETVQKWEFDDHGVVTGLWQQDWEHPEVFIPIEKIALFRTDSSLGNPEGRSILRGSYVQWVRKKAVEESEGRAAIRAAGLVVLRVPGTILKDPSNAAIKAQYETMATNLAADRQGAVLLPSDVHPDTKHLLYGMEYVMADGRRSADMTPIVGRYDQRIASTVLADFIMLGQGPSSGSGSFALSKDKTDLFSQVLWGWAQIIAGVFNRQVIRRAWKLNGLPTETMPTLVPGEITAPSLESLGSYISSLAGIGMNLFPDEDLENYLRKIGGLPKRKEGAPLSDGVTPAERAAAAKNPPTDGSTTDSIDDEDEAE